MDTFGAEVDFVLASSHFSTNPHLTAAIPRIRSICSITSAFWFNSTSSVPLIPRSDALINTIGLEQSKTVTSAGPYPGTSKISFFLSCGEELSCFRTCRIFKIHINTGTCSRNTLDHFIPIHICMAIFYTYMFFNDLVGIGI